MNPGLSWSDQVSQTSEMVPSLLIPTRGVLVRIIVFFWIAMPRGVTVQFQASRSVAPRERQK